MLNTLCDKKGFSDKNDWGSGNCIYFLADNYSTKEISFILYKYGTYL
jgi:hypothetical protein